LDKAYEAWKQSLELNMDQVLFRGAIQSGCRKTGRKDGRPDRPDGVNYLYNYDGSLYTGPKRSFDFEPRQMKKKRKWRCDIF